MSHVRQRQSGHQRRTRRRQSFSFAGGTWEPTTTETTHHHGAPTTTARDDPSGDRRLESTVKRLKDEYATGQRPLAGYSAAVTHVIHEYSFSDLHLLQW